MGEEQGGSAGLKSIQMILPCLLLLVPGSLEVDATALYNAGCRAGCISVSAQPNAVCSGPLSAAANQQEQQFGFFQYFHARNL